MANRFPGDDTNDTKNTNYTNGANKNEWNESIRVQKLNHALLDFGR